MPIFEFRCSKCGHLEEVLQKFDDPAPNPCPECAAKKSMSLEISRTSFQLKGGGWYKDLYSSVKKEPKGEAGSSSETKKPTKAAEKATKKAKKATKD